MKKRWFLLGVAALLTLLAGVWNAGRREITEKDQIGNHPEVLLQLASVQTAPEREQALEGLLRAECRYLGMQTAPALRLEAMEQGRLGYYCRDDDQVVLNRDYVLSADGTLEELCRLLCHEVYHRYQFEQIALLQQAPAYGNLLLFQDARSYEEELRDYSDGLHGNFDAYADQQMERDAEAYAQRAAFEYQMLLDRYRQP